MTEPNLDTFKFNWNGTNYTFYDSSLVLAMNFNNNSQIGENDTKAVDISQYGNNGTIYGTSNTLDNTTILYVNQTNPVNLTHLISIPAVNFTSDFNLTISYLNNTYANETIRVYVNGSYIGNFTTIGATTTQYAYFYNISRGNFTAGATSNITYEANSTNVTRSRLNFNHTLWGAGKFGNALQFDGVNDYVDAGNASNLNITNAITIEAWVKPYPLPNAQTSGIIVNKYVANAGYSLEKMTYNRIAFRVGGGYQYMEALRLTSNVWYHIVGTWNGSTIRVYRNGVEDTTGAGGTSSSMGDNTQPLRIGYGNGAYATNYFNGTIDEVRIYNRSLSASEIAMHYLSEFQKYNATTWQFYNNITNQADRTYTYYAWANDTSNNANQTEIRTLTIDNLAPLPMLILPQNSTYPTTTLSLNYTVSDVSLDKVWYIYNSQNVTLSGNTAFTALNNSQSTLYLYANDTLGRVNVTNVTFTVDTIYPQISFVAPTSANNSIVNRDWIYANVSINDTNFKNVTFILQNSTAQVNSTAFTGSTTGAINWTNLAEGQYYYNATVFDLARNSNSTGTMIITLNSTPAITIVSPSNRAYVQNWVWANLTLGNAGSWCGVSLNGTAIRPLSNASATSWYLNLSIPSDSLNNVTFYCNNSIGNWANSQTIYFTTSTTPPFVSFTSTTPLPLYANYVYVNTTVNDTNPSNNLTAFIDWNRSLVGWWRFNDEPGENSTFFRDWSTYGNNGTCSGTSCPALAAGKFGNALQFDGVNDYVDAGNAASLNITNAITIEAWINPAGFTTGAYEGIVYKQSPTDPSQATAYALTGDYSTNKIRFWISANTNGANMLSTTALSLNTWYYVVGTYDTHTLKLYINGVLENTGSYTGNIQESTGPLKIGYRDSQAYWNGTIDEVRIWNRTLTASEIMASYNAGRYALYRIFNSSTNSYNGIAYAQNSFGNVNQSETRTFNVTASNNTYFLIGTGTAITNTKVLPTTAAYGFTELSDTIDYINYQANNSRSNILMTAARGEYEPASFLVNSNENITYLNVTVSNLAYGQNTIPSSSIDIRAVKVWYQAGTSTIVQDNSTTLAPELLLHDDSLVITNGTSNFIKGYNCTNCYINISNPHWLLSVSNSTAFNEAEAYLTANVKPTDSDTLQPINITANTLKQFWITAHIPENAAPGTYIGTINLTSRNDTSDLQQNTITLQVEVLPFSLENSSIDYSVYYVSRLSATPSLSYSKSSEQIGNEMRDMKAHGIDNPNIYEYYSSLSDYLTIRAGIGFKTDKIYYVNPAGASYTTAYTGDITAYNNTIFPLINISRSFGYNDVYFYGVDEASGDALTTERASFNATHILGAKTFVTCYPPDCYRKVGDLLDAAVLSGTLNSSQAAEFHSSGNRAFSYGNPQMGVEQPATYRRNYGLVLQRAGYDGAMDYAYQYPFSFVWNDFDNSVYKDHVMAYPTWNGSVIDTIQWEGFREGVDDTRYLATLQKYINEASRNGTGKVSDLGLQADSWINTTDFTNGDLDQIRADMITNIKNIYYALITVQSPSNQTYGTNQVWMNITVNQTKSWCGVSLNGATNQTLTNSTGNVWSLRATIPSDGIKSAKFYCNDTSDGGMSGSRTIYFTVDTTPPSVSLSLPQSSIYAGDSITIYCSASDSYLSTTSLTITKPDNTPASATCNQPFYPAEPGTYTVQYSAADTSGNSASTSQTFLASRSPSSSLGSSFSSGGGSGSPSKAIVVTSNEAAEKIIVNLRTQIQSAFLTITQIAATAIAEPVPAGQAVYQYLNITKTNFENADIETARIDFHVNKAWYSESDITPASTVLLRYDGTSWRTLPTVKTGEDLLTYSFSANTTSFSIFAIAGTKRPNAQPTPAVTTTTSIPPTPIRPPATPTPTAPQVVAPRFKLPSVWTLSIILISIILLLAALYIKKSKPPPKPGAQVTIKGIVTSHGLNDFDVFDGTGFISVKYGKEFPPLASRVEVKGTLSRQGGQTYIAAKSVRHV